jgi:hypothetical protein
VFNKRINAASTDVPFVQGSERRDAGPAEATGLIEMVDQHLRLVRIRVIGKDTGHLKHNETASFI